MDLFLQWPFSELKPQQLDWCIFLVLRLLGMIRVNLLPAPQETIQRHVLLTIASDICMYRGEHILILAMFKHMHYLCDMEIAILVVCVLPGSDLIVNHP